MNDFTLSERIKNGGEGMPSFRFELSDTDVADLVAFVRDKCCWDPENPPPNPQYHAAPVPTLEPGKDNVRGGPWGFVRSQAAPSRSVRTADQGAAVSTPLEGIMVQLRGTQSNITTTVYSDDTGRFEFPKLKPGTYSLRIARALEFKPFYKASITIDGAAPKLDDIVLERVSAGEFVPPNWDTAAQLSGAELVWNVDGTAEEKRTFSYACGSGCHTYGQILRNRFDERSWRLIVTKMTHNTGSLLLQEARPNRVPPAEQDVIVKWLTKVRGPNSKDMGYQLFPAPHGAATKVVVTEYELPRLLTAPHDPVGDARGNIWYNSHRTAWLSKLDPATGTVEDFKVPSTRGANPGQHWLTVDERDTIWFSENWSHKLGRFDPKTEKFEHVQLPHFRRALNAPAAGNLALAPDHSIWEARDGAVHRLDPITGQVTQEFKLAEGARRLWQRTLARRPLLRGRRLAGGLGDLCRHQDRRGDGTADPHPARRPQARRLRPRRQRLVRRHRRPADQVRCEDQAAVGIPPADPERDLLRMHAGQERRNLGRRTLCRPHRALQPQDRPLDRICFALPGLARPADVDRQLHDARVGVVCGP